MYASVCRGVCVLACICVLCMHGCVYGFAYMGVCPYVCVQVGVLCTCTQALGEVLSHVIQKNQPLTFHLRV